MFLSFRVASTRTSTTISFGSSSLAAIRFTVLLSLIISMSCEAFPHKIRPSVSPSIRDRLQPGSTVKIAFLDKNNFHKDNEEEMEENGDPSTNNGIDNPVYILGYWAIRGLAAPIRMMMSAAQVNHWVIHYHVHEDGETGWTDVQYTSDKRWLQSEYNPLMNLPFLIYSNGNNDCFVLTHTNAILAFLGRELNMLGSNSYETTLCEELLCEIMDLRDNMIRFAYPGWKDFSDTSSDDKADAFKLVTGASRDHLDKIEAYLEAKYKHHNIDIDNPNANIYCSYLVGDRCSAPDFHLWEMLAQYESLGRYYQLSDELGVWYHRPFLKSFFDNFQQLPENKAYMQSKLASELLYNNPTARFGADPSSWGPYRRGHDAHWMDWGVVEEVHVRTSP